jgi:hypothetical protein
VDERGYAPWGLPTAGPLTFETLSSRVYPPDRDRVRAVIEATRTTPGPYEIDFAYCMATATRFVGSRSRTGRGLNRFLANTTSDPSPSHGGPTQIKSSPLSDVGTKR